MVCDATIRGKDGRSLSADPGFLGRLLARREFIEPAFEGLGSRIGALVFQLSAIGPTWLARMDALIERLAATLANLPDLQAVAPRAVIG